MAVRDFSDSKKQEMIDALSSLSENDSLKKFDWLTESQKDLGLTEETEGIAQYLDDIQNIKSLAAVRITHIIESAHAITDTSAQTFAAGKTELEITNNIARRLLDAINFSAFGDEPFDANAVRGELYNLYPNVSVSQYVSTDAQGNKVYHWDKIEALLHKDGYTTWEMKTLVWVMQEMTTVKEDGTVVTDYEALATFYERGYSQEDIVWKDGLPWMSVYLGQNQPRATTTGDSTLKPTRNFLTALALYVEATEIMVAMNSRTLLKGNHQRDEKITANYVKQCMIVAALNDVIISQGDLDLDLGTLETWSLWNGKNDNLEAQKQQAFESRHLGINIVFDEKKEEYNMYLGTRKSKDGAFIPGSGKSIVSIKLFSSAASDEYHKENIQLAQSLYRSKIREALGDISDRVAAKIVGEFVSKAMGKASGVAGIIASLGVDVASFTQSMYSRNRAIDRSNAALDTLISNLELKYAMRVYCTDGVVYRVDGQLWIIPCFDDTELQMRLHHYNAYMRAQDPGYEDITLDQLKAQIGTKEGNAYLDWWDTEKVRYLSYREQLENTYESYKGIHPEFHGKLLNSLTLTQINKLIEYKSALESAYQKYQETHPEFANTDFGALTSDQLNEIAKIYSLELDLGETP